MCSSTMLKDTRPTTGLPVSPLAQRDRLCGVIASALLVVAAHILNIFVLALPVCVLRLSLRATCVVPQGDHRLALHVLHVPRACVILSTYSAYIVRVAAGLSASCVLRSSLHAWCACNCPFPLVALVSCVVHSRTHKVALPVCVRVQRCGLGTLGCVSP